MAYGQNASSCDPLTPENYGKNIMYYYRVRIKYCVYVFFVRLGKPRPEVSIGGSRAANPSIASPSNRYGKEKDIEKDMISAFPKSTKDSGQHLAHHLSSVVKQKIKMRTCPFF